jgi:cysteine protease ATG4
MEKAIGAWFGPNCMAQVIKSLTDDVADAGFVVHVAMDSCLSKEDVRAACVPGDAAGWIPLLLIVPLRLGMDGVNKE